MNWQGIPREIRHLIISNVDRRGACNMRLVGREDHDLCVDICLQRIILPLLQLEEFVELAKDDDNNFTKYTTHLIIKGQPHEQLDLNRLTRILERLGRVENLELNCIQFHECSTPLCPFPQIKRLQIWTCAFDGILHFIKILHLFDSCRTLTCGAVDWSGRRGEHLQPGTCLRLPNLLHLGLSQYQFSGNLCYLFRLHIETLALQTIFMKSLRRGCGDTEEMIEHANGLPNLVGVSTEMKSSSLRAAVNNRQDEPQCPLHYDQLPSIDSFPDPDSRILSENESIARYNFAKGDIPEPDGLSAMHTPSTRLHPAVKELAPCPGKSDKTLKRPLMPVVGQWLKGALKAVMKMPKRIAIAPR